MFIIKSIKKSKAMNNAVKTMSNVQQFITLHDVQKQADKEQKAFDRLFKCMQDMSGFSEILVNHNATADDICSIAKRILCAGYRYQGRDFLPVALISFGKPLDYILAKKDQILNHSYDEIRNVVEVARLYL